MNLFVIAIIAVMVILTALVVSRQAKQAPETPASEFPYEKTALCSPAERSFFGVLTQLVGERHLIFVKVSLYDVIKVKKGLTASDRQTAFNRISKKHLDFVVCEPSHLTVVCAVELDDSSHRAAERQERDAFLEKALRAADIPLLHFPARQAYSLSEVREQLVSVLSLGAEPVSRAPNPTEASQTTSETCPSCDAELVVKTAKRGANAGQSFLACPNYPDCKFTAPL